MNKKILILVFIIAMLGIVNAEDARVGLYLLNLGKFDVATGQFTADFYLSIKCEGDCDAQNFEFLNGRATSIDKIIDEPNEKFYRIQATLNSPVDLQSFPFDRQKMQIILEHKTETIDSLKYIPNLEESGVDDSITFTGWNMDGWDVKSLEHDYTVYDEKYSQYVFNVNISRIKVNSLIKTFLPVFFIIIIVLFSQIIDPDKIATRITLASSSLIAAVMFHISISNQIPPVGYLTFADKFMVLTYFILLSSFVINFVVLELSEQKKIKLMEKVHRATEFSMLIIVPLLYILLFLFFI